MHKKFNSLKEVLRFLKRPKSGRFDVYLNNKNEVEVLKNKVYEVFAATADEIEYAYRPNEHCNDHGIEWVETFHYLEVCVVLEETYCGRECEIYRFDLKVRDF